MWWRNHNLKSHHQDEIAHVSPLSSNVRTVLYTSKYFTTSLIHESPSSCSNMSSIAALKAQIEALELQVIKESKEKQVLQTEKKERVLLARGEYFTQLRDVLGTERVDFTGGFRAICGRMHGGGASRWREKRLPEYTTLESELLAKVADVNVTSDDLSYASKSPSDRESIAEKGGRSKLSKEDKDVIQNKRKNKLLRAQSSSGLSRSSRSGSEAATDPGVKMIDIGTVTNAAHLLAGNNSCSPTMGIFVQAIIGCDLEAKTNEHIRAAAALVARGGDTRRLADLVAKQKKVLQNLAYHRRHYKGFCNIANNLIQVPKGGHEKFFDIDCDWVIAPIMPFSDIIGWNPETVQWKVETSGRERVLGHVHRRNLYKDRHRGLH